MQGWERGKPGLCPGYCSLKNELPRGISSFLMPARKKGNRSGRKPEFLVQHEEVIFQATARGNF